MTLRTSLVKWTNWFVFVSEYESAQIFLAIAPNSKFCLPFIYIYKYTKI